jgi:hypothetical protein
MKLIMIPRVGYTDVIEIDPSKPLQCCYECGIWGQDFTFQSESIWRPEDGDRTETVLACPEHRTEK